MSQEAKQFLIRALQLLQNIESQIGSFRTQVVRHDAQLNSEHVPVSAIGDVVQSWRNAGTIGAQKTELVRDLQIVDNELRQAESADPQVTVEFEGADIGIEPARAYMLLLNGQIEMLWGNSDRAIQLLTESCSHQEMAATHFMLGLAFESQYRPKESLFHYEKCLALEPTGDYAISALREAEAMRSYKRRFRGSWGAFGCLFIFFFPFAIVYYMVKRK
jgi:tetratricopeptide (TPR) repeat protein